MIKRIGIAVALLLAGLPVGAAGSYAALRFFPEKFKAHGALDQDVDTQFVQVDALLVPLVFKDGRLAGYISLQSQLEVPADEASDVTDRLPLFMNAVNMRTYRSPLASGPDGQLPDLSALRAVLLRAAVEVYGKDVVRKVTITHAVPS